MKHSQINPTKVRGFLLLIGMILISSCDIKNYDAGNYIEDGKLYCNGELRERFHLLYENYTFRIGEIDSICKIMSSSNESIEFDESKRPYLNITYEEVSVNSSQG